jgi:uroporphyrinogen decarboxylase
MRQAGRYLPEYHTVRAAAGGMVGLCNSPEHAAEVTLQPIRRFHLDAAIVFADLPQIAAALGQSLEYREGDGPILSPPVRSPQDVEQLLDLSYLHERLTPVYETVSRVAKLLPADVSLVGYAGAPWTVATYMVAGQGSRDQSESRRLAYSDPDRLTEIVSRIEDVTFGYLSGQIEAGAEAVQLFDSWAGSLAPAQFEKWVIGPTARLVQRIAAVYPGVPIIGFPKGAGGKLRAYAEDTGVDCVGIDETVDPVWANRELPAGLPVQGNLDPLALVAGGDQMREATVRILDAFRDRPHIFNLGHGILPDTPVEHVEQLVAVVKGRE